MRLFQPDTRQRRTVGALFVITFVVSVLLTAFFQTQVVSGEQYAIRSEENRLRPITIPAPRGTIVDRYGEIVATSIPGYSLLLLPGEEDTIERTLRDLAVFLGLSESEIDGLLKTRNGRPNDLLTITEDATYSQVAAIEERRTSFPNLLVVERPKRFYPAGRAIGHLIGYVNEISSAELELPKFEEAGYTQGRIIGKSGIEREYELLLSGQDGARFVEVDARGRVVNPRSTVGVLPPVPGQELKLSLDLGLQKYLHQIFPDTMKGAVAVMAPSTGEILALYSSPGYDPNDFVGGIPGSLWTALRQDSMKPLLHRAVAALYPPGSTWKLATAVAGLRSGIVQADTHMPIACNGGMFYAGRYAKCWDASGHGSLDLVGAIENSCNVYFYQLGIQLGLKDLVEAGVRMGFSSETGLDIPGEQPGEFPTSLEWYKKTFGSEPTPSEVMSLAIGQGPNAQTALRMAQFYSAIAGDGTAPEPFLAYSQSTEKPEPALDLGLTPDQLEAIWTGLAAVVDRGTARLSALERWQLYGKTGTSQNPHGDDHGWFTGFAGPKGKPPEVAFAVIIEHGLHGSDVAPIAAKAAEYYLDKKYGLPFDPQPTRIERLQSGRFSWNEYAKILQGGN
ncbi:MAG TPA: penicillin-binding protein 2 [Longimicrobiaceae bacterium]|nr:penicillin-binding protein 2 [Longimicrobiaceae bacterium]